MSGGPSAFRPVNIEFRLRPLFWAQPKSVLPLNGSAKRFRTSGGIAVGLCCLIFLGKAKRTPLTETLDGALKMLICLSPVNGDGVGQAGAEERVAGREVVIGGAQLGNVNHARLIRFFPPVRTVTVRRQRVANR